MRGPAAREATKQRRRQRYWERVLLRAAGPFTATSRADGTILIECEWPSARPKDCTGPVERTADGDCRKCGMPHIAGFATRMPLARAIEERLNRVAREATKGAGT